MLGRAIVLFGCFVGATGFVAHANHREQPPMRATFDKFPIEIAGWRGVELPPFEPSVLAVLGADDYVNRAYYLPDRSAVGLYVGYYGSQRQGDTIHSPLNCLPGAGWEPLSKAYLTIPLSAAASSTSAAASRTSTSAAASTTGDEGDIVVNRYVIQKGLDQQLVLYWYQSHGRVVANEYWSKYYLVRDAMRLNRTDAALVRVIVPIQPNVDEAEHAAEQLGVRFVRALFPVLPPYLPL